MRPTRAPSPWTVGAASRPSAFEGNRGSQGARTIRRDASQRRLGPRFPVPTSPPATSPSPCLWGLAGETLSSDSTFPPGTPRPTEREHASTHRARLPGAYPVVPSSGSAFSFFRNVPSLRTFYEMPKCPLIPNEGTDPEGQGHAPGPTARSRDVAWTPTPRPRACGLPRAQSTRLPEASVPGRPAPAAGRGLPVSQSRPSAQHGDCRSRCSDAENRNKRP